MLKRLYLELLSKLLENVKQYVLFIVGSCCILGKR